MPRSRRGHPNAIGFPPTLIRTLQDPIELSAGYHQIFIAGHTWGVPLFQDWRSFSYESHQVFIAEHPSGAPLRLSRFLDSVLHGFGRVWECPESPWAPQLHRIPTNSHQNFTRFRRILIRVSSDFHRGAELGGAFDPRLDTLLIRIPSGFHRGAPFGCPFAAE